MTQVKLRFKKSSHPTWKEWVSGLLLGSVLGTYFFSTWAQAGNQNCSSCEVLERWKSVNPSRELLSAVNAENLRVGWSVARGVSGPEVVTPQASPLQFTGQTQAPSLPAGQTWWDGQGDLPGGFKRPWEFPKTNYDPSFVTSYYTPGNGALNTAWAPWSFATPSMFNLFSSLASGPFFGSPSAGSQYSSPYFGAAGNAGGDSRSGSLYSPYSPYSPYSGMPAQFPQQWGSPGLMQWSL